MKPSAKAHTPAFDSWLEDFFVSYFRRRPVNATFIGVHDYDDRLPDLSESGIGDTLGDAEDLLARLRSLPSETLSQPRALDKTLATGFLLTQRWECSSAHFGAHANPTLFTGEALFGLISLLLRPQAPARLEAARARLGAVPVFLDAARRLIRSSPAAWIERARRECEGARRLLSDVSNEFSVLAGGAQFAMDAFERFDAFLADDVLPTPAYAAGEEALDLLLRHAHMLATDADGVEMLALERIAEEEEALSVPVPDEVPSPLGAAYLERFEAMWRAARDLARDNDLLSFPEWPVHFVDRPRWAQAAAPYLYFLPYRSPPPYDALPVVDYLVPPGSDDSTIKLNHVVHHASLGHQVQNWFAARAASRIGQIAAVDCASRIAMLCGGTMAEGWATYATDLADECNFLTAEEHYAQHRARLRMAARAVVDVRLHQGRFTLNEAIDFYSQRVRMPGAAARAEAVKNSLFPGAACMYLIGWDGIWRLRREIQSREGSSFSLRAFHDRLLSWGSVPVSLIAQAMLGATTLPSLTHL